MNIGLRGLQDQGKTLLGVRIVRWLLTNPRLSYVGSDVYSTVKLNIPETNFVSAAEMMDIFSMMVEYEIEHRILFVDEIDKIYSHRFWSDKKQSRELLGWWHDIKLFNTIIWTAHLGAGVDLIIRDATQIEFIPYYNKENDSIDVFEINCLDAEVNDDLIVDFASEDFKNYNRWARLKMN